MKILVGTETKAEDVTALEIADALRALRKRGEGEALRARMGCALTVIGVLVAGVLLYLGYHYALGIEGLLVLLIYHYSTSLDPELADDPRLRFGETFVEELSGEEKVDEKLSFWMELNAYDMEIPDERESIAAGCVRSTWKQSWFRCEFEWGGVERTLEIRLEATQEQDGIHVTKSEERHFITLLPGNGTLEVEEMPDAETTVEWLAGYLSPRASD